MKVNFGTDYHNERPYRKENKIEIPEKGQLSPVPDYITSTSLDIVQANLERDSLLSWHHLEEGEHSHVPAVSFHIGGGEEEREFDRIRIGSQNIMILLWVEPRSEWIAVHRTSWSGMDYHKESTDHLGPGEGAFSGNIYKGPYALDDYCRGMLSKAFGVDVSRIGPSDLEALKNFKE